MWINTSLRWGDIKKNTQAFNEGNIVFVQACEVLAKYELLVLKFRNNFRFSLKKAYKKTSKKQNKMWGSSKYIGFFLITTNKDIYV